MTYYKGRRFYLKRDVDISGVSGTGIVAEGVEFQNGMCAVSWLSPYACVNTYANIRVVEEVHSHEGATSIVFLDENDNE